MMGKQTKPNIKLRNLLESSSLFCQDLLGYSPEQTSLQQVPKNDWAQFITSRGLNPNSSGIYLPRNQSAIIRDENLENDFLRSKFEGYSQTYLANALALRQGLRLFSKEDLLSHSRQEKLIQLKGGTEKNAIRKYDGDVSTASF